MPKAGKTKGLVLDEFPALTRLLEEIAQLRENERVQPRLPFGPVPGGRPHKTPRRPAEKKLR